MPASFKPFLFLFSGFLAWGTALSQNKAGKHIKACDCLHAIEVTDSIYPNAPASLGSGVLQEIISADFYDPQSFHKEHHSTWYKFKALYSGDLEFEIIPEQMKDDYDFMLFRHTGNSFCEEVKNKRLKPIRACISRNDSSFKSITGISQSAGRKFIPAGKGDVFASSLHVQKGEWYILVVDNVYENGKGHTLRFHYKNKEVSVSKPLPKVPEAGQSISFDQLRFVGNMDIFLPESKPYLDTLLQMMKEFPGLKILIEGHVNGPESENTLIFQDLSERRAKAVYHFLIENGIVENRLKWLGYGNTRMKYLHPLSESQSQMNRRVEIQILEK